MRWFKPGGRPERPEVQGPEAVPLGLLVAHLSSEVPRWEGVVVDLDLLRARLADHCRDAAIRPAPPGAVAEMLVGLDAEAQRRAALVASALDLEEVRAAARVLLGRGPIVERVRSVFVEHARGCDLLTLELLRQGPLRVEEFARKWLAALGTSVAGETEEESRLSLERLDYGRLLAEAERAKQAAEPRLAALRKLQEQRDALRARRGKV